MSVVPGWVVEKEYYEGRYVLREWGTGELVVVYTGGGNYVKRPG